VDTVIRGVCDARGVGSDHKNLKLKIGRV
jgi:hypothetical protein